MSNEEDVNNLDRLVSNKLVTLKIINGDKTKTKAPDGGIVFQYPILSNSPTAKYYYGNLYLIILPAALPAALPRALMYKLELTSFYSEYGDKTLLCGAIPTIDIATSYLPTLLDSVSVLMKA